MPFREGVNGRWFVDCDTNEERKHVGVCYQFQASAWDRSDLDRDALKVKARQQGWSFVIDLEGKPLTFCPGCVPLAVRTAEDRDMHRRYLRGLAKPLTRRDQIRRCLR